MKHKHYEMIVAKAANMDLVVFLKHANEDKWKAMRLTGLQFPDLGGTHDYFMCLQKHSKEALSWLNGVDVQGEDPNKPGSFDDYAPYKDRAHWSSTAWYMRDDRNVRIKPKKEKRWIAVDPSHQQQSTKLFKSEGDLWSYFGGRAGNASGYQFIEIEVEV